MGRIEVNTHPDVRKAGGYNEGGDGWHSQPNTILHELGHMVDYYMTHLFPKTGKEQIGDRFDKLDESQVKKILSEYGATQAVEFRAELISGILAGKAYPKEFLTAAYLDKYLADERGKAIFEMGSGEAPNTTMLEKQFGSMMQALFHEEGASLRIEILGDADVEKFIDTHAQVLDNAFVNTEMSDTMRARLKESDWIFSGMKTFHELNEAFPSLLDEKGNRKTFEQFLNDVQTIDQTYNRNYLSAEYNLAQASAEMAARWEKFEQDGDDYYLQYRTAGDDKVRPEHAELNGITLPMSDSFWDTYYPPNGWNCRCTVVQVLKDDYVPTPHDEAVRRGSQAVPEGTKTAKMFAYNPGKDERTFPAYNPYTISKCLTCPKALNLAADISDNECCSACNFVRSLIVSKGDLREEYNRFDPKQWIHHILTDSGYVVIDNNRPPEKDAHPNEHKKYHKELSMCEDLAHMGHRIKFLSESNRTDGSFDIFFDDISADLKKIDGNGSNIPKFTKHAFREQGAEVVVFCLPSHDTTIYNKLTEARRKYGNEGKIYFYFNDDKRLREI